MVSAGMPLRRAAALVAEQLAAAGCPDAAFDAGDLCLLVSGQSVQGVGGDTLLSAAQAERLNALAARRANREPLQYLWGRWPFLNFEVQVGEGVLCPRADTEVVTEFAAKCCAAVCENGQRGAAEMALADVLALPVSPLSQVVSPLSQVVLPSGDASKGAAQVLELCGGSGCIGLGIKMFCPSVHVTVLEKSKDALPYLRENAAHALDGLAAEQRAAAGVQAGVAAVADMGANAMGNAVLTAPYIHVVEGDLFAYHATLPDAAFDVLVSNPPYLTADEMTQLQPEVAREPAMALAAGQDGLDFYRAIAHDYKRVVRVGGFVVLEIGCDQAADVMALLTAQGWREVICKQDYGKNDRCVIARR